MKNESQKEILQLNFIETLLTRFEEAKGYTDKQKRYLSLHIKSFKDVKNLTMQECLEISEIAQSMPDKNTITSYYANLMTIPSMSISNNFI